MEFQANFDVEDPPLAVLYLGYNVAVANFKVSIKLPPSDESTLNKFARIIFVIPPLNF